MSKFQKITITMCAMVLLVSGLAMAEDPLSMFTADGHEAVNKSLMAWCAGDRNGVLDGIKQLVKAESGMMAFGVNFTDERLYSRLATKSKPNEPEHFAYLMFLKRMSDAGYAPQPAQNTFSGRRFDISRIGSWDSKKINF